MDCSVKNTCQWKTAATCYQNLLDFNVLFSGEVTALKFYMSE